MCLHDMCLRDEGSLQGWAKHLSSLVFYLMSGSCMGHTRGAASLMLHGNQRTYPVPSLCAQGVHFTYWDKKYIVQQCIK